MGPKSMKVPSLFLSSKSFQGVKIDSLLVFGCNVFVVDFTGPSECCDHCLT